MIKFSESDLRKIREILKNGWSEKTTFDKDNWSIRKKSCGQCYVTARTFYHIFGGEVIKASAYNHYWNKLPSGKEIDFTSDQFKKGDGINKVKVLDGKPKAFKPIEKCKSINPRLRKFLIVVEKPLREFKKQLRKKK